jgi:hypothetical protein
MSGRRAMSSPSVRSTPLPETTEEVDVNALSNTYLFILSCHAKKTTAKDSQPGGPDNAEDHQSDRIATKNYSG